MAKDVEKLVIKQLVIEKQPVLIQKEGLITVTKTRLKQTQTVKAEHIKIRPFITATASVSARFGFWMPTGDMAGAKGEVEITVPCYLEELVDVFKQVKELASELIDEQVDEIESPDK